MGNKELSCGIGDLLAKRPGNGIKPSQIEDVIGKVLACDVGADEQISWDMFNE